MSTQSPPPMYTPCGGRSLGPRSPSPEQDLTQPPSSFLVQICFSTSEASKTLTKVPRSMGVQLESRFGWPQQLYKRPLSWRRKRVRFNTPPLQLSNQALGAAPTPQHPAPAHPTFPASGQAPGLKTSYLMKIVLTDIPANREQIPAL